MPPLPHIHELRGRRVLLTRTAADNRDWAERLAAGGARVTSLTCLATQPLNVAAELARACQGATWLVLGSRRAAALLADVQVELPAQIACVGPATAAAARAQLGTIALVSTAGTLADLGRQLAEQLGAPTTLVHATADRGRRDLEDLLEPHGHTVRRVALYATKPAPPLPDRPPLAHIDAIVVASPSALEGLEGQRSVPRTTPIVALGPTSATAARAAGFVHVHQAPTRDLDGVASAIAALPH